MSALMLLYGVQSTTSGRVEVNQSISILYVLLSNIADQGWLELLSAALALS